MLPILDLSDIHESTQARVLNGHRYRKLKFWSDEIVPKDVGVMTLAKRISKVASDAGVHLSSFLNASSVNKSSFYKWSVGGSCSEKSRKKMELLLLYLEQMKLLRKSLEEKNRC